MEIIKRIILLENSTDRENGSKTYGQLVGDDFYINIFLTQDIDDMGVLTDMDYIKSKRGSGNVDYSILTKKMSDLGYLFPFMVGGVSTSLPILNGQTSDIRIINKEALDYYNYGGFTITGNTDSKYEDMRTYNVSNPFRLNFDVRLEEYINYKGETVYGVDKIISTIEPITYHFNTENEWDGIKYKDNKGNTTFEFKGQGWNETNISLSASTKEEFLFGIISKPEVKSDIFIDRGYTSITEMHLRLSEINTLDGLERYGNGYYKINRQ